jgi:alpha-galactosidase
MKEKVVIIGAGSAMFTIGLVADVLAAGLDAELALVDIDPEALEVAESVARKMVASRGSSVVISASTDRKQVLPGATAVICTVGVGGRRGWERDVFIPRKYGIFQPVGDTVGPGGTSRALRMIPVMVAIAEDVLALCPRALFVNYSNPMTAICTAIRRATSANVTGLCHGVGEVEKYLADQLGVPHSKLNSQAVGLNHLTWFTKVESGGADMSGRLEQIAREKLERQWVEGNLAENFLDNGQWQRPPDEPEELNPVSWQLMLSFGAFPAAMDRHVSEFFGLQYLREGSYFGCTLGVDSYSFERTIAAGDYEYEIMREQAAEGTELDENIFRHSSGEHEQVIDILQNIRGNRGGVYSANLPNRGQFDNIPEGAVLESPATASAEGLRPIRPAQLTGGQAAVIRNRLEVVELTVQAALECSREKFVQALVLDGAVESCASAEKMADELLAAQRDFLPGAWFGE